MVPAVSIMSSISTHMRPSTSPITSRASTWLTASPGRRLYTAARSTRSPAWRAACSATLVRPVSGATITKSPAGACSAQVVDEQRDGGQVVDRAVEEPLDLTGVQVDAT